MCVYFTSAQIKHNTGGLIRTRAALFEQYLVLPPATCHSLRHPNYFSASSENKSSYFILLRLSVLRQLLFSPTQLKKCSWISKPRTQALQGWFGSFDDWKFAVIFNVLLRRVRIKFTSVFVCLECDFKYSAICNFLYVILLIFDCVSFKFIKYLNAFSSVCLFTKFLNSFGDVLLISSKLNEISNSCRSLLTSSI